MLWNIRMSLLFSEKNKLDQKFMQNMQHIRNLQPLHSNDESIATYSNELKNIMLKQNEFLEHTKLITEQAVNNPNMLVSYYQIMQEYNEFVQGMENTIAILEDFELTSAENPLLEKMHHNIHTLRSMIDINHMLIKKMATRCERIDINAETIQSTNHIVNNNTRHAFPK